MLKIKHKINLVNLILMTKNSNLKSQANQQKPFEFVINFGRPISLYP